MLYRKRRTGKHIARKIQAKIMCLTKARGNLAKNAIIVGFKKWTKE